MYAEDIAKLGKEVEAKIGDFSLEDVSMVTPKVVKDAASKL